MGRNRSTKENDFECASPWWDCGQALHTSICWASLSFNSEGDCSWRSRGCLLKFLLRHTEPRRRGRCAEIYLSCSGTTSHSLSLMCPSTSGGNDCRLRLMPIADASYIGLVNTDLQWHAATVHYAHMQLGANSVITSFQNNSLEILRYRFWWASYNGPNSTSYRCSNHKHVL